MPRIFLMCFFLLLLTNFIFSQEIYLQAYKTVSAPKIDGDLSDAVWSGMPEASDFIQNYPATGSPASQKSVIRIMYDNSAVYVGAYLYDDPKLIRKQITARDAEQQKDVDY